jgi:hypothetical protein
MEKYIEELNNADCFTYLDKSYVVTCDFKKNGDRCCIDLTTGFLSWFKGNAIVNESSLYSIDKDNNFYPIKNITNVHSATQNKNLS